MLDMLKSTAEALLARGYKAIVCENRAQACDYVLSHLKEHACVGIGGSMTVKELGLADTLRSAGHEVLWHWETPPADRPALLRRVLGEADAYLCSANALCQNGTIVEIDGNGNRVAALCYGPEQVFLLVGRNKLVDGTVNQAITRIKREACGKNARRLGLSTPCAVNDRCDAANCRQQCAITVVLERAPGGGKVVHVLLIDEDLGF